MQTQSSDSSFCEPPPLRSSQLAAYGVGSIATAMFNAVPALVLLYFLTQTLLISPAWAGLVILLPKLWDVVTDPLMGVISDRTRSPWGRRRPWMLLGACTMPLAFLMMFSVPDYALWQSRFWWVMAWYLLAASCFTMYVIPYVSMPAEMTNDYHQRTRILSWRMGFVVIGVLLGGALAPLLIEQGGGGRVGHQWMGGVLAGVMFVAMLFTVLTSGGLSSRQWQAADARGWPKLKLAFANKPFKALMLAYLLMMVAANCLLAAVPFFANYVLGRGGETVTLLFLCHLLPSLLSIPFWNRWSRRVGKQRGLMFGVATYAGGCVALYVAGGGGSLALVAAIVFVMGLGMGAIQLYPFAMVPDVIDLDRRNTGQNREGLFMGIWIANEKIGIALGAYMAALMLELHGFVEGAVVQSSTAFNGVLVAMGLAPTLLLFLSLAVLKFYSLDRELLRAQASNRHSVT